MAHGIISGQDSSRELVSPENTESATEKHLHRSFHSTVSCEQKTFDHSQQCPRARH